MLCRLLTAAGPRLVSAYAPLLRLARSRHSVASDLPPGERLKKQLRGTGVLKKVRAGFTPGGAQLRRELSEQGCGAGVLELVRGSAAAGNPEFGKAFQKCGELRDCRHLMILWHLARDRGVPLTVETYGILITALARTARGRDGRGIHTSDRTYARDAGKAAWHELKAFHAPALPQFGAALGLCAKVGDAAWAAELWAEMLSRALAPTIVEYTQYLDVSIRCRVPPAWDVVDAELSLMSAKGVHVDAAFLGMLLNAAAVTHDLQRLEWAWRSIPGRAPLNALLCASMAKGLILCGEASRVPDLRAEMVGQGIHTNFRTYVNEVQALLLALHASPQSATIADSIDSTVEQAYTKCAPESRSSAEEKVIKRMQALGHDIVRNPHMPLRLSDVQVNDWPWKASRAQPA